MKKGLKKSGRVCKWLWLSEFREKGVSCAYLNLCAPRPPHLGPAPTPWFLPGSGDSGRFPGVFSRNASQPVHFQGVAGVIV